MQGEVIGFDAYHKRVKLRFDDGYEEWVAPQKEQFRWLLPRAASAGCTAAMAHLMADLGAKGALTTHCATLLAFSFWATERDGELCPFTTDLSMGAWRAPNRVR